MFSFKKITLFLVAAGSILSAHAQMGPGDAERRAVNREAVMERRMRADREGGTSVPVVVPAGRGYYRHHGWRVHPGHHRHMHRHHMHRRHLHRHHVR